MNLSCHFKPNDLLNYTCDLFGLFNLLCEYRLKRPVKNSLFDKINLKTIKKN